jgi:hypothetical protein
MSLGPPIQPPWKGGVRKETWTKFRDELAEALEPALDEFTEGELLEAVEHVVRPVLNDVHDDDLTIANIPPIQTLVGTRWGHEYAIIVYRLDS